MKKERKKREVPVKGAMTGGDDRALNSDVQGSWTGNPLDGGEPVQDADDL